MWESELAKLRLIAAAATPVLLKVPVSGCLGPCNEIPVLMVLRKPSLLLAPLICNVLFAAVDPPMLISPPVISRFPTEVKKEYDPVVPKVNSLPFDSSAKVARCPLVEDVSTSSRAC